MLLKGPRTRGCTQVVAVFVLMASPKRPKGRALVLKAGSMLIDGTLP